MEIIRESEILFIQEIRCEIAKLFLLDPNKARCAEYILFGILESHNQNQLSTMIQLGKERLASVLLKYSLTGKLIREIWLPFFSPMAYSFSIPNRQADTSQMYISDNNHFLLLKEEIEQKIRIIRSNSSNYDEKDLWNKYRRKRDKLNLKEQTVIVGLLYQIRYEIIKNSESLSISDDEASYMIPLYQDASLVLSYNTSIDKIKEIQTEIKFEIANNPNFDLNKILSLIKYVQTFSTPKSDKYIETPRESSWGLTLPKSSFKYSQILGMQRNYGILQKPRIKINNGFCETSFMTDLGLVVIVREDEYLYDVRKNNPEIGNDGRYTDPDIRVISILPLGINFFYCLKDGLLCEAKTTNKKVYYHFYPCEELGKEDKPYYAVIGSDRRCEVHYFDSGCMDMTAGYYQYCFSIINHHLYNYVWNIKPGYEWGKRLSALKVIKEPLTNGYRTYIIQYDEAGKLLYSVTRMDDNLSDSLFELGNAKENRGNVEQNLVFDKPDVVASLRRYVIPPEEKHRLFNKKNFCFGDTYTDEELYLCDNFTDKDGNIVGNEKLVTFAATYEIRYNNGEKHYYIDEVEVTGNVYFQSRKDRLKPTLLNLNINPISVKTIGQQPISP